MTSDTPEMPAAGLFRRLAAMVYDGMLLFGLWVVTSALLLLASGGRLADPGRPTWLVWFLQAALLTVAVGFFSWFWTHGGQTLGMRAWRLRLVSADGGPVGLRQALTRLAAAGLALAPAGLGLLWMLIDRERLAWHDRLSGTRLVVVPKQRRG